MKSKNSLTKSLNWTAFGVYIVTLYKIAVLKYMPMSIIDEQFGLVDLSFISKQLAIANFIPLKSIIRYIVEDQNAAPVNIIGNVITFMPLGFFLLFVLGNKDKLKMITLAGFGSSLSIEVIQLISGLGRFDVDDIILNTFGACLGLLAYRVVKKMPERSINAVYDISLHDLVMRTSLCFVTLFNFLLLVGCRFF
jgi:glycopeptide antibiotics resistance protein